MSTESDLLLQSLRDQSFYKGQVLRVRDYSGQDAKALALPDALERASALQGGVLSRILPVSGIYELYASTVAALVRAYSQEDDGAHRDAILISPYSAGRELFWQLVCLSDALDFSRMALVLCRDDQQMDNVRAVFDRTLKRADIQYALTVASISVASDFSAFTTDMPMVVLFTPESLDKLLSSPSARPLKRQVLSALGRVAVPCLDDWPAPLASHVAFLMRRLHVDCAMHGAFPALAGTMLPTPNAMEFIREFWGKPISAPCLIKEDTVESPPICLVNYGGALLQNPGNKKEWTREPISDAAVSLLKWLVHADERHPYHGAELHYVLDTSGSMTECLKRVSGAVEKNLESKLQDGEIRAGDKVILSSFQTQADCKFNETFDGSNAADLQSRFADALAKLESEGGTDIPEALGTALGAALAGTAQAISVILFSDGQSTVSSEQRASLLALTRQARSEGRLLGILYVVLDMEPPPDICNLIEEMGGAVVLETDESRNRNEKVFSVHLPQNAVVLLSGEKGLPEDVVQSCQAGVRPLVFARAVSDLFDPSRKLHFAPRDVWAIVVSGRYGSLPQILDQVKHLGRQFLPVFVLSEPEAWSQALCENHPASRDLLPSPLICSQNRHVAGFEIAKALPPGGTMDADIFAYLLKGSDGYLAMLHRLGLKVGAEFERADSLVKAEELPNGFALVRQKGFMAVRRAARTDQDVSPAGQADEAPGHLRSWGQNVVTVRGDVVVLNQIDATMAEHPLLFHKGAIVDEGRKSVEVNVSINGETRLAPRSQDRHVPLLENVSVTPLDTGTISDVSDLGRLALLRVRLLMSSPGYRCYAKGNLDDLFRDVRTGTTPESNQKAIETDALRWIPAAGASQGVVAEGVRIGLSNILRLMIVSIVPWADRTLFVYPDDDGAIWVVDLAPGGNGAAQYLFTHLDVLQNALRVGGEILLECPCEGGFAGASTAEPPPASDSGCPRCARVLGPVIAGPDGADRCARVSKRATIEWLMDHRYLPTEMARLHLREKFEGIDDVARYKGSDDGTRRAIMPLVHRILKDRLGLDLPCGLWASLRWLPNGDTLLGTYSARDNTLAIQTMLREWMAYSVCAHEVFHNLQARLPDLFDASLVTNDKIDLEGSAVWAESHILDALAIRTALDMNNLRSGDEYAAGFQRFKYIESRFGTQAVLKYLRSGSIATATDGAIGTSDALNVAVQEGKSL